MGDIPRTRLTEESENEALARVQRLQSGKLDRKAKRDPRSALRRGGAAGINNLHGALFGVAAIAGDAIGNEELADYGIKGYQDNADESAENLRGLVSDLQQVEVDGVSALGEFVAVNLGMMAPNLLAVALWQLAKLAHWPESLSRRMH